MLPSIGIAKSQTRLSDYRVTTATFLVYQALPQTLGTSSCSEKNINIMIEGEKRIDISSPINDVKLKLRQTV